MKSNMNLIIIIIVILLIDVVGGFFIGKKVLVPYSYEREMIVGEPERAPSEAGEMGSEEPGTPIQLEPINLNPANSAGEIFSCTITLITQDEGVVAELGERDPADNRHHSHIPVREDDTGTERCRETSGIQKRYNRTDQFSVDKWSNYEFIYYSVDHSVVFRGGNSCGRNSFPGRDRCFVIRRFLR